MSFSRKRPKHEAGDWQLSRGEIVRRFQEQARRDGLDPVPDDAEIIVLKGAMTGAESRRAARMIMKRMGLDPDEYDKRVRCEAEKSSAAKKE